MVYSFPFSKTLKALFVIIETHLSNTELKNPGDLLWISLKSTCGVEMSINRLKRPYDYKEREPVDKQIINGIMPGNTSLLMTNWTVQLECGKKFTFEASTTWDWSLCGPTHFIDKVRQATKLFYAIFRETKNVRRFQEHGAIRICVVGIFKKRKR